MKKHKKSSKTTGTFWKSVKSKLLKPVKSKPRYNTEIHDIFQNRTVG